MRAISLIIVVFCITGTQAFVYTCNEISNTLVRQKLSIPSKYACVVLQDSLNPSAPWLTSTFVRDDASEKQYSLSSFSFLPDQPCVSGAGPWRVVEGSGSSLDCTFEITLLFSSVLPNLAVAQPHNFQYITGLGSDLTFVSPRGGISINWHTEGLVTGYEQISFFSGVGSGPEEDLYPIGSILAPKNSEGRDTDIFDPVVTVKIPSNISVEIGYISFADKALNIGAYPGHSVTVLSSGRATTFQEQNTMKVVQANYGRRVSVQVKASISFDPSTEHTLKLQAFCTDSTGGQHNCGEKIVKQSTEIEWLLNAEKFRVNYITGLDATQIGKNSDNVFITVVSSRAECSDDFLPLGDRCYGLSDSFLPFSEAEEYCAANGGHLASIHNGDTNSFIQSLASTTQIGVFIGLKKGQKEFKWTDGSNVDYKNGHLDDFGGECAILGSFTGTWSNADCELAFKFICEKEFI